MESEGVANKVPASESGDKDKTLSSQVLEYYKKYSQNRELPKYFCGTSSSFKIEDWHDFPVKKPDSALDHATVAVNTGDNYVDAVKPLITLPECSNLTRPPLIGQDHLCEPPKIPDINVVSEVACVTSPTSSVASNRKLEWDNGADIGYSNVETHKVLQKSISLPVLTNLEYGELRKSLLRLSPEGNTAESTQVQQPKQSCSEKSSDSDLVSGLQSYATSKPSVISFNPPYSSSTSESVKSSKKEYRSSSSSSAYAQKQLMSDSESSTESTKLPGNVLKSFNGKVGLPLAESTPIIRVDQDNNAYYETPKLVKDKESNYKRTQHEGTVNKSVMQSDKVIVTTKLQENFNFGEKSSSCENLSFLKTEEGLKKWHSQIDLNMVDQVSHYKNLKILKLSVSKPVVVECMSVCDAPNGRNKFIQTSLPRNTSVAIQTDFDFTNCQKLPSRLKSPRYTERQSVLYLCHSDSDKERSTHSSATQTNSGALSKCNSFEYLYGADYDQNLQQALLKAAENQKSSSDQIEHAGSSGVRQNEPAVADKSLVGNLKRCPPKSDLTTVSPDSDKTPSTSGTSPTSSKESPLAELISSKQSGQLVPDLQKNLQLLQKVIKSKKYDDITKKYFLKKIVQKMVDSKFAGSSSESVDTSEKSEVNLIRKSNDKEIYQQVAESNETSSKSSSISEEKIKKNEMNLHENKPWLPFQPTVKNLEDLPQPKLMQPRKLQTQTFVNEILPDDINYAEIPVSEPAFIPYQEWKKPATSNFVPIHITRNENIRLQRNRLFTLTDDALMTAENATKAGKQSSRATSTSTANELYEMLQPATSEIVTPPVSSSNSSSLKQNVLDENRDKNLQSWRDGKTRSEQLLEQKAKMDRGDFVERQEENKDHLVHFAKRERQHQLYWINNEISHLSKLKKLLEREHKSSNGEADTEHKILRKVLEKPHVEDMKQRKKSTTVYIVTTERSSASSKYSSPHNVCDPKTCTNPHYQGRYICPVPVENNRNARVPERPTSPKPKITCRCRELPCRCADEIPVTTLKAPSLIGHGETVVSIEDETIDLRNARLVSSEQFTTGKNGGQCRTSIRRYTFEVPMECTERELRNEFVQTQQIEDAVERNGRSSPKRVIKIKETNEHVLENEKSCSRACSPKSPIRLTRELVVTDEIVGRGRSQSASPQRSTCQICPKGAVCRCTQTSDSLTKLKKKSRCCSKISQCSCSSSSSSSSSASDSPSESSATQLCCCCKRRCTDMLRARLEASRKKYFCQPCYNQNRIKPYYVLPGHVCTCYSAAQSNAVQQMRDTLQELQNLEKEEDYCKCLNARAQSSSGYCSMCKCRLREKYKSGKGGLAYVLTLESDEKRHKKRKKKSEPVLEEIKIKVSSPRGKHKHRQTSGGSSDVSRASERSSRENLYRNHRKKKSKKPTLQDYLCANKPNFIASAEQRRNCLLELAYLREQRCQKYKQLLALTNGIPLKNCNAGDIKKQHVFSSKEMKELTAKNYKKLSEVQQKLIDNRDKQIKKANKLLADIFTQKLRQQVLKGKHTLPPDASIIKLV